MHWKNYLYFSSFEKIAVLILVVLIVLAFGLNVLLSSRNRESVSIPQNDSLIAAFERLQESLQDKKVESNSYASNSNSISNKKNNVTHSRDNERKQNDSRDNNNYTESPQYIKQEKFTTLGSISLNETDTAEWKKVPGIGSAYSARIVKYGNLLGGYISINQLKEVYGFNDDLFDAIAPYICEDEFDPANCVKTNINQLEFREILAHPYINYEQTKAIVNLRKRTGIIASINQLAMLDEFTSEDIERITPYLEF